MKYQYLGFMADVLGSEGHGSPGLESKLAAELPIAAQSGSIAKRRGKTEGNIEKQVTNLK